MKSGDVYRGEFSDGFPHGKGTLCYQNGDSYVGEFDNGVKHGFGKLVR